MPKNYRQPVWCPYCKKRARLMDSKEIYGRSYGNVWACLGCDAYVGVHKNHKQTGIRNVPLGHLANAWGRALRKRCHGLFDFQWKDRLAFQSRSDAYQWMSKSLGIPMSEAHIAMLSDKQCLHLIELLKEMKDADRV